MEFEEFPIQVYTKWKNSNKRCIEFNENDQNLIITKKKEKVKFVTHMNFQEDSEGQDIFDVVGIPQCESLIEGLNSSVICFGEKGSGKTMCMLGENLEGVEEKETDGILPRAVRSIYDFITEDSSEIVEYTVMISCFEIGKNGKQILDLMTEKKKAIEKIHFDSKTKKLWLKGKTEEFISNDEELFEMIEECLELRDSDCTFVFVMSIQKNSVEDPFQSTLTLIDLASRDTKAIQKLGKGILTSGIDKYFPPKDDVVIQLLYSFCFVNCVTNLITTCSGGLKDIDATIANMTILKEFAQLTLYATINSSDYTEEDTSEILDPIVKHRSSLLGTDGAEFLKNYQKILSEKDELVNQIKKLTETHDQEKTLVLEELDKKKTQLNNVVYELEAIKDEIMLLQKELGKLKKLPEQFTPQDLINISSEIHKKLLELSKMNHQLENKVKVSEFEKKKLDLKINGLKEQIDAKKQKEQHLAKLVKSKENEVEAEKKKLGAKDTKIEELVNDLKKTGVNLTLKNKVIHKHAAHINILKTSLSEKSKIILNKEDQIKSLDENMRVLQDNKQDDSKNEKSLRDLVFNLQLSKNGLQEKLEKQQENFNKDKRKLTQDYQEKNDSLEFKQKRLDNQLKEAQDFRTNSQKSLKDREEKLRCLEKEHKKMQIEKTQQNESLSAKLKQTRWEYAKIMEKNESDGKKVRELESAQQKIQKEHEELKKINKSQSQKIQGDKINLERLTSKIKELEKQTQENHQQSFLQKKKLDDLVLLEVSLTQNLEGKEKSIKTLEEENAKLKTSCENATEKLKQLQEEMKFLKKSGKEDSILVEKLKEQVYKLLRMKKTLELKERQRVVRSSVGKEKTKNTNNFMQKSAKEYEELESKLHKVKLELFNENKSGKAKDNTINLLLLENKTMKKSNKVMDREFSSLRSLMKKGEGELSSLKSQNTLLKQKSERLKKENHQLVPRLKILTEKYQRLESSIEQMTQGSRQEKEDWEKKQEELNTLVQLSKSEVTKLTTTLHEEKQKWEQEAINLEEAHQKQKQAALTNFKASLKNWQKLFHKEKEEFEKRELDLVHKNKAILFEQEKAYKKNLTAVMKTRGDLENRIVELQRGKETRLRSFATLTTTDALEKKILNYSMMWEEVKKSNESLTEQVKQLKKNSTELQEELNDIKEEKEKSSKGYEEEKDLVDLLKRNETKLNDDIETLKEDKEKLENEIQELETELTEEQTKYRQMSKIFGDKDTTSYQDKEKIKFLERQTADLTVQVKTLNKSLAIEKRVGAIYKKKENELKGKLMRLDNKYKSKLFPRETLGKPKTSSKDVVKRESKRESQIKKRRRTINRKAGDNRDSVSLLSRTRRTKRRVPLKELKQNGALAKVKSQISIVVAKKHSGYLSKQGSGYKSWKKRWFALKGRYLRYYYSPKETNHIKSLDLGGAVIEERKATHLRKFCFSIKTAQRTLFLNAASAEERDKWMKVLRSIVQLFSL